jgi:adenine-specific DNA-methyltransferase
MQAHLPLSVVVPKEAYDYGERTSGETHGVVLTRPHVVDLILDLAEYTADRDLGRTSLLEPAVGHGAFLVRAVRRFLQSCKREGHDPRACMEAFLAFDIDPQHVAISRKAVASVLVDEGLSTVDARRLATHWVVEGDFLLAAIPRRFDVVVGNPPYVRIEQLAPQLQSEYRHRYESLFDRADLYVAFIERSLDLLGPKGVLSFVCADRWTLNRYGAPLRRKIAGEFHVHYYVDLHTASPFESEVIAYPSIFAIGRNGGRDVHVGRLETASPAECSSFKDLLRDPGAVAHPGVSVATHDSWFAGEEPWVLSSPERLSILRDLERRFAPLEADGKTQVRIGVATGADKVFIVPDDEDIEQDRLVPLVMREDIHEGKVRNAHRCVINTFSNDGSVVDLDEYPKLAKYLDRYAAEVKKRHVAQRNPLGWFRTIDRVYPHLVPIPKLLIPDIAGSNEVVLERGMYHPHHNLYFVISEAWDLKVLGGLLSSRVALFFVWSYAVKMRGGYLRFQAQYLRRIRVPEPSSIPKNLAGQIGQAFDDRDFARLDELAMRAYGLKHLPEFDFVDTRR